MRCKVGDLCIIINSDFPKNIGKTVEVNHYCDEMDCPGWLVSPVGGVLMGYTETGAAVEDSDPLIVKDCDLLPINPDSHETIETPEELAV